MTPLPWHEVELAIHKEQHWLQTVFDFGPYAQEDATPIPSNLSRDKMLRQIAIAIVNGTIEAKEIRHEEAGGLWSKECQELEQDSESSERHGGHWHQTMMAIVKRHFIDTGFEVINEPTLSLGRADLGVYKERYPNLYVEIGTTSLFKTWFNTQTMLESIFLFVPTTTYAIELKTHSTPHYDITK
jgi:hypothetical protein